MRVEKDCKLHLVLAVVVMGASHAVTVHIVCTTAVNAWLAAITLCPFTELRCDKYANSLLILM